MKHRFAMMFLLPGNICLHRFQIGLAHGEIRVSSLSREIGVFASLRFKPAVGNTFQLLHPFRLRNRAGEPAKHVNVIFNTANHERRTFERFGNAAALGMELVADSFVAEEWPTFFRREHEVDVNGG